ncbi:hypothetical protein B0H66DRAFT_561777 [Apodospora peruviana]|uniref:Cyclin-D1-binding protein 1-like N-terminal domain-containing protein n=1 Tax=Apodospora peruviana TaxID=516989 RepID=A0AAE0I1M4_9PEZI|nr:hypothetical protein B0H66DRAFT_561777 [Apodospora peruviana]
MASSDANLETLNSVVSNTVALITQLETVIAEFASQKQKTNNDNVVATATTTPAPDALSLAHDSVVLIKAHATKISLLIINDPFTPTAIVKVLRDLTASPLPALVSAVQLCAAETYTKTIQRDLAWQSGRVLRELKDLVSRIPSDGKILKGDKKTASAGSAAGKGSLAATGTLWAACDEVAAFAKRGYAGNLVRKVEQFRDTLKDVMEELKEWGEETGDDEDGDEEEDDGDDDEEVNQVSEILAATQISDTQAMLDDLMNSQEYIPRDDPDKIRERLESCLKRLRLTTLLYQAIIKRRLKPLPHAPVPPTSTDSNNNSNISARLDEIIPLLAKIPERFGSLAMAFYELGPAEIDNLMDQCFFDAFAVSELLMKPWEQQKQKDEFTDWALKFQVEIKKP